MDIVDCECLCFLEDLDFSFFFFFSGFAGLWFLVVVGVIACSWMGDSWSEVSKLTETWCFLPVVFTLAIGLSVRIESSVQRLLRKGLESSESLQSSVKSEVWQSFRTEILKSEK